MTLKAKEIDHAWKKLGMVIKDSGDRHALFKYKGKLILRTKRSFGSGKLDGNIPHLIRQQLKLNEDQFADLINCPLLLDDYISILKEKKIIKEDKKDR